MEIIVLPYLAISFSIAWAIFSPFAAVEDLHEWTFAKVETGDLFAVFLPICLFLAVLTLTVPDGVIPTWAMALILGFVFAMTFLALWVSLYLLAKMNQPPPFKRMAIVGIIVPMGSFLTIGWIVFPLVAYAVSMLYSIPATLAIIPLTFAMRGLSHWVCQNNNPSG